MLCASTAYLATHGMPQRVEDLQQHDCIVFIALASGNDRWRLVRDGNEIAAEIRPRLSVNTAEAAAAAAEAGIGIAQVLSYQVAARVASGDMKIVLQGYTSAPIPVSLVYPGQRQVPLKLRAFLDFAAPRLRARLGRKTG